MSKAGREFMKRFLAASPEERQVLLDENKARGAKKDEGIIARALARRGKSAEEVEGAVVWYRVKRAENAPKTTFDYDGGAACWWSPGCAPGAR